MTLKPAIQSSSEQAQRHKKRSSYCVKQKTMTLIIFGSLSKSLD